MTSRHLLFDVGNTRIKWGVAHDGKLRRTGSISHKRLNEQGYAALTTRLPTEVDGVLVSNVAGPTFATRLSGVIGLHCDCDVHFARSSESAFGVTNSYRQPRRLGVDRWVAMVGARAQTRKALCIVDAGTAVTIDALDRHGQHLGGQIFPGLKLMTETLAEDTSNLPNVRRKTVSGKGALPGFASSTAKAIYEGSLGAVCGAIERCLRTLRSAKHRPALVLTGGDASRILGALGEPADHRPNLVLEGLAIMIEDEQ